MKKKLIQVFEESKACSHNELAFNVLQAVCKELKIDFNCPFITVKDRFLLKQKINFIK